MASRVRKHIQTSPEIAPETTNGPANALTPPTDTYLGYQWHLSNLGQTGGTYGIDIDVLRAWDDYRGNGVKIAVIDDGFDMSHTDLAANFDTDAGYDFRRNDTDPSFESGDRHGTAVAGVIAADDNGSGMVGIAPNATLAGLRVSFTVDSNLAMFNGAMATARDFDIVNNSWGFVGKFADDFNQGYMDALETAIFDAVSQGRGGLGTNIVFAAGNSAASGDNVNYHNLQNSAFTISVGAIDKTGHIASFSTQGAAVLVSAPGVEIYTTDNTGSEGYFQGEFAALSGTSFSAPVVSGVIALMLDANANLGYRDVQEILALSARQIDSGYGDWQTNGAGLHFSHAYGFGLVDAHTAVRLAETWGQGTGTLATLDTLTGSSTHVVSIPDGTSFAASTITIPQDIIIDRVEITFDIDHADVSQLDIVLVSPDGTESRLAENAPVTTLPADFVYSSVANWGEHGAGTWILKVYDSATGAAGTLNGWTLRLLGDEDTPDDRYVFTDEFSAAGSTFALSDTDGGTDTFNAASLSTSVVLDLSAGMGFIGNRAITVSAGTTIEKIYTGDAIDAVTGDAFANVIDTGRGDDYVFSSHGVDVIYGGAGTDTYFFNDWRSFTLTVYDEHHVALVSKISADYADLHDFELYQIGADIYDLASLVTLYETPYFAPDLIIDGSDAPETLIGDDGNDLMDASGGNDTVYAAGGNDVVKGGGGDDILYGQDGSDTLFGENGNDTLWGGLGDDTLWGSDGNDLLYGQDGNDFLYGGTGDDVLYGGAGDDVMAGGLGFNRFYGGTGNDTFVIDAADSRVDRIYEFRLTDTESDKLDLSALLGNYNPADHAIANFLEFSVSGADTAVRLNEDGQGDDFVTVARVYGATLTQTVQNYVDSGLLIVEKTSES